jgi:HD-GYP domain-containing protein (c-di-GMP phosphodiesterase class II)
MLVVNFLVTRTLVAVVRDGSGFFDTLREELAADSPLTLSMIALGTLTAVCYAELGLIALALFALTAQLPQLLLPVLLRPKRVSELDHSEAVALYAQAIGRELRLSRRERLVLKDSASYMRSWPLHPRRGELSRYDDGHRLSLVEAVLFHGEHWDGSGGTPGSVGGEMIPLLSRVLAVADSWAGLTSIGSPRLTHAQALNQLEARAGMHFDPRVVGAAARVAERLGSVAEDAYQPRTIIVRAPRIARRLAAAASA